MLDLQQFCCKDTLRSKCSKADVYIHGDVLLEHHRLIQDQGIHFVCVSDNQQEPVYFPA